MGVLWVSRATEAGSKHRGLGWTGDAHGLGQVAGVEGGQDWDQVGLSGQVGDAHSFLSGGICDEIAFSRETRTFIFTFNMETLCQFTRNWESLNSIFIFDKSFLHVYGNSKWRFTYVKIQVGFSHKTE